MNPILPLALAAVAIAASTEADAQSLVPVPLPADVQAGDGFGFCAAVSGDILAVSAPFQSGEAGVVYVYRHDGTGWQDPPEAVLTPADFGPEVNDEWFGFDLDVSATSSDGAVLVVSEVWDDENALGAWVGAAYVYRNNGSGWVPEQKLAQAPGDFAANEFFGMEIATSGDLVAVSAPNHAVPGLGSASGAVYVWRYDPAQQLWVPDATVRDVHGVPGKLWGDTTTAYDQCGTGVDVSVTGGVERIVTGAPNDDDNGLDTSGTVFVFRHDGAQWVQEQALWPPTPTAGEFIGFGVAIDGDLVAAASRPWNEHRGRVVVWSHDGTAWGTPVSLTAPSGQPNDILGLPLALDAGRIIAGAERANAGTGAGYVFEQQGGTWSTQEVLPPAQITAGETFVGMDVSDSHLIFTAYRDDADRGSVFELVFADADTDGLSDGFEAGFGGATPTESLAIVNPETGDTATGSGSASTGATVSSGSVTVEFPAGTTVEATAASIGIEFDPGSPARLAVSGADLGGGTKSITMPFDPAAANASVCIEDAPGSGLSTVLANGVSGGVSVVIPATDGASSSSGPFLVTRVSTMPALVRVDGLSNTALATYGDADLDGIEDGAETTVHGTDPNDDDTDDDGLLDGVEAAWAPAGCLDPLVADSDGDLIPDGDEVTTAPFTNPCNPDTDGDGLWDRVDPDPLTPPTSQGAHESTARSLAAFVDQMRLAVFAAPNDNARAGRRNSMSSRIRNAANSIARGQYASAATLLSTVFAVVDGADNDDWVLPSAERNVLTQSLASLIALVGP